MIFKIIVEVQNSQIYRLYAECNKFALRFGIYFYVTVQTKTRKGLHFFGKYHRADNYVYGIFVLFHFNK